MAENQGASLPQETLGYLSQRLEGARDLYLLALALGARDEGAGLLGRMIREARVQFAAVIEEARIAGLDTHAIAEVLATNVAVAESIRPEVWARLEQLLVEHAARKRGPAG